MPPLSHNALREPLIGVRTHAGEERDLSLPDLFALLAAGDEGQGVAAFRHLQPHQAHFWHAFLTQLGALVVDRADIAAPSDPAAAHGSFWRDHLLALSSGSDAAWSLVVDDPAEPALLQPPVPDAASDPWKRTTRYPDTIDLPLPSTAHSLKADRIRRPRPDHWLFALVAGQTANGYSGRTWYGTVRMNGGLGNRAGVSFTPSLDWARWWRRDVRALGRQRDALAEEVGYDAVDGHALLWLLPWDGGDQVALEALDPFFVEVGRRYRMIERSGTLALQMTGTNVQRVDDRDRNGVVGDPWLPYRRDGSKALTLSAQGWTYTKLHDLLLGGDWSLGAAGRLLPDETGDMYCVARTLVRGQGKTEGYHERVLPVPGRAVHLLRQPEQRARLGERSRRWIEIADRVRSEVLGVALWRHLEAGGVDSNQGDEFRYGTMRSFRADVDDRFFSELWDHLERGPDEAALAWAQAAIAMAEHRFREALSRTFVPAARRPRARAEAELTFRGRRSQLLTDLSP